MDAESKLIYGLLCHIGKTLRGKQGCKKCPYFKDGTGKCHGNLAFDALSYILSNEYGKYLLDSLDDIQEINTCKPYSISEDVMEDIRSGKGLKPINKEARIKRLPPLG